MDTCRGGRPCVPWFAGCVAFLLVLQVVCTRKRVPAPVTTMSLMLRLDLGYLRIIAAVFSRSAHSLRCALPSVAFSTKKRGFLQTYTRAERWR